LYPDVNPNVPADTDNRTAPSRVSDESRFITARSTLIFDRFMTWFIKVGGALVILAVSTIFVFIGFQILPLFRGAEVKETQIIALPSGDYCELVSDEDGKRPALVDRAGRLLSLNLAAAEPSPPTSSPMALGGSARVTAVHLGCRVRAAHLRPRRWSLPGSNRALAGDGPDHARHPL
jgi:hypothetical protein